MDASIPGRTLIQTWGSTAASGKIGPCLWVHWWNGQSITCFRKTISSSFPSHLPAHSYKSSLAFFMRGKSSKKFWELLKIEL